MTGRLVLAFSGGPSSTDALTRLAARAGREVVALAIDLGQRRELDGIRDRALAAGALRCHVLDLQECFAREVVWPAIRAGVDPALPPVAVAAPILARALLDIARIEGAGAVAHAARGRAALQFDGSIRSLDAQVRVHRGDLVDPPSASLDSRKDVPGAPTVVERSLWGRLVTDEGVGDPWTGAPPKIFSLSRSAGGTPDEPAELEVTFERGTPVALNGVSLPLVELLEAVDTIAGVHGVGRHEVAGIDQAGRVWREIRETPALTTLRLAHQALTALVLSEAEVAFGRRVGERYTALLADGSWHAPIRRTLDLHVDAVQARVSGTVRLALGKGQARLVGRRIDAYDRPAAPASMAAAGHR